MFAVIFEVCPKNDLDKEYFDLATKLRPLLDEIDGFISIERFRSLTNPDKLLSLSYWSDEKAISAWRHQEEHHAAQVKGKNRIFRTYRISIAEVTRCNSLLEEEPSKSLR